MASLFADFADVWTPVAMAADLKRGRPLGVRVAGTALALFRDADGAPAALLDRCPHRGASLSLGRLVGDCIECPFHGWRFDAAGRAVKVPWNPDAKLANLAATGVPARELGGQIWVYTSATRAPVEEPTVNEALHDPRVRISGCTVQWHSHWTRVMENMLDWPHLPFVHRRTIGKGLAPLVGRRMDVVLEDRPWGFRTRTTVDGEPRDGMLDFRWPNQMNLHITLGRRKLMLMVACVPVDDTATRLLLTTARDFLTHPWLDYFFNRANLRIATEDRAIVESSDPPAVPQASEEQSVRSDAPTLRFRKAYFARLARRDVAAHGPSDR
jgi:nitrite reductase/ring-hydroxylating ferredoxin subunit